MLANFGKGVAAHGVCLCAVLLIDLVLRVASAPVWSAEIRTAPSLDSWDSVILGSMIMLYCVTLRQHWIAW